MKPLLHALLYKIRQNIAVKASIGVMLLCAVVLALQPHDPSTDTIAPSPTDTTAPSPTDVAEPSPYPTPDPSISPSYLRLQQAPNGQPWPTSSGYVKGYPQKVSDGLSSVRVDNSKNDSDVFVKLYALNSIPPQPARVFFIKQGGQFTAKHIRAGGYDVRYQDLETGTLSKSEPFELVEEKVKGGTRFSNLTMTLYEVSEGNMQTYPIPEAEF